jgi:glycosyltransferase involved in cell wall biosynthesis
MSDRDINILYNACDIGINTCDGEGFGLCQFEHAALGCPQVAPKIGGIQEFLNESNSTLIDVKWKYYIDKQRDGIGGIGEIGDTLEYADAIWKYYMDKNLVKTHGKKARKDILQHYRWDILNKHFHTVIKKICT